MLHNSSTTMKALHQKSGFTIVELLVVIVIIAILAAISVVTYNGIQNRARASAAASALSQASKRIILSTSDNDGNFPANSTAFFSEIGANGSGVKDNVSFQYSVDNSASPKTYCITATVGTVSYKITELDGPIAGACPGHVQGGQTTITNLATNPNMEGAVTPTGVGGATVTKQTSSAIFGSNGIRVSCPANSVADCGASLGSNVTVTAGTTYTYRASIRAVTAGAYNVYLSGNSGGGGSLTRVTQTLSAGQTSVLTTSYTASASGGATWYILRGNGSAAMNFDVDGLIVTQGTSLYNFADGSYTSSGWSWNGTANASTSSGPAL